MISNGQVFSSVVSGNPQSHLQTMDQEWMKNGNSRFLVRTGSALDGTSEASA